MLDLNKIEKGKLELECIPFDLLRLVADIEQVYKYMPHGLQWTATVEPDVPSRLCGDPNRCVGAAVLCCALPPAQRLMVVMMCDPMRWCDVQTRSNADQSGTHSPPTALCAFIPLSS